jgi:hypothetical protein
MAERQILLQYLLQTYEADKSPAFKLYSSFAKKSGITSPSQDIYDDEMSIIKAMRDKEAKKSYIRGEISRPRTPSPPRPRTPSPPRPRTPSPVRGSPQLAGGTPTKKKAALIAAAISVYESGAAMSFAKVKSLSAVPITDADYKAMMEALKSLKTKEKKIAALKEMAAKLGVAVQPPSPRARPPSPHPPSPRPLSPAPAVEPAFGQKTILQNESDVPEAVWRWATAREISLHAGMTKESYCDAVFAALAKEQALVAQKHAEYEAKISALAGQLASTQTALQEALDSLARAQEAAKSTGASAEVVANLQVTAQSLTEAVEEVETSKADAEAAVKDIEAAAEATAAVCNTMNSWAGSRALSETAADDLACPVGTACDIDRKSCVAAGSATVINTPVIDEVRTVPVIKSCFTENEHKGLNDLASDLDCGTDLVCDVNKHQCVPEIGLRREDIDEVIIGGRTIKVTGENRSSVVDAIKREIAAISAAERPLVFQPIKPGQKPINLRELSEKFKSLSVRPAPSVTEEEARKAHEALKKNIGAYMRK